LGLSALSVNWGAIGDTGVAARGAGILEHLRQTGLSSIDSSEALAALGMLLLNDLTQAGVFDVDWVRWRRAALQSPVLLQGFMATTGASGNFSALEALRQELRPLEADAQRSLLSQHLRRQLARILRQKESHIVLSQAVGQFGLDSLMTLEWVLVIQKEWDLNVSAVELMKSPSLSDLAAKLLGKVLP
jgi:acyl carrier protein